KGRFEALLNGLDQPFAFSYAKRVVGAAVQQADTQLGADQTGVRVDEGLALVGVEFAGQAPAQDRFLKRVMKGLGVGVTIIGGKRDQTRMVIDQDAQVRR